MKVEYEYALVRLVPRVEREEFINIGVVLYCRKQRYADFFYHTDHEKWRALYANIDVQLVDAHLRSFKSICLGSPEGGDLADLEIAERFRWLAANRSTMVQCSPVHTGIAESIQETHQNLLNRLVL